MQLVGYIQFMVVTNIDRSLHQNILERMYNELREYLMFVMNPDQNEAIMAVFFCSNIPTVESILITIKSYDGVQHAELLIMTKVAYYTEWLKREIDKKIMV